MTLNRFFITLAAAMLSLAALAQPGQYYYNDRPEREHYYDAYERSHDMYFGLRLGFNASAVRSGSPELNGTSVMCGLNAGAVVGYQILPNRPVYVESGLFYSEKGGKSHNNFNEKFTYELNYLELPIVFKYNIYVIDNLAIVPQLGGFLAVGVAGKIKDYKEKAAFSSYSDNYFRRFDGGLRFGVGAEYKMFYADMTYDLGLANIGHDSFNDTHTGAFALQVGVNF